MRRCTARGLACRCLTALLALGCPAIGNSQALDLAQSPPALQGSFISGSTLAGGTVFSTRYDIAQGSGSLQAWRAASPLTPLWDSADLLDRPDFEPAGRTVLTHTGKVGVAFRWQALAADQKAALSGTDGAAVGRQRLDFIRGSHAAELPAGGPLRQRGSRQGDIVNSRPWADRGTGMVYVGGNDGMLHGFDAATGQERLAYVPRGVFTGLRTLSQPGAEHRYRVDGSPFTGEADLLGAGQTSTVLFASPGAGAKGYFLLDISRPAEFAETNAARLVLVDTTVSSDPDIGFIVSEPASGAPPIVQLNNGRWAVLTGNGVNSPDEMPVLLLQYLDGVREMFRLRPACPVRPAACGWRGGNGLASPTVIDIDGDGRIDIAYAGDLKGHVWKYDLSSWQSSNWKIAFQGTPLFTARDAQGQAQAITVAPSWLPHPAGGVMLALGTGRQLTMADRSDASTQSLYGLYDDSPVTLTGDPVRPVLIVGSGTPINQANDPLRPASLAGRQVVAGSVTTADGRGHERIAATAGTPVDPVTTRGWWLDLPAAGERLLQAPQVFSGRKLLFHSTTPAADYLTVLDLVTGLPSTQQVFAAIPVAAAATEPLIGRTSLASGGFASVSSSDENKLVSGSAPPLVLRKGNGRGLRVGWRQLP